MSAFLYYLVEDYNTFIASRKDPLIDTWILTNSPLWVIGILISYLYFVLKLGPDFMKRRQAYKINTLLILYNFYQVAFHLWLLSLYFHEDEVFVKMLQVCEKSTFAPHLVKPIAYGGWWFVFSKHVDLLDTVFFVLRKKQSHVTFLHVYHHTLMVLASWLLLKFLPSEQGAFICFMNIIVHIIMYTYYLISALGPAAQKYLWWKKYLTLIQIAQFVIMILYLGHAEIQECGVPKLFTYIVLCKVIIFLCLFLKFYKFTYNKQIKVSDD